MPVSFPNDAASGQIEETLMAGQQAHSPKDPLLAVWFALGLIFALFVGTASGILGWLSGEKIAAAVLTGFATLGGTVTLVLLVINLFRR
jgi:hypothetical protein